MNNDFELYKSKDCEELIKYFLKLYIISFNFGIATDNFQENRKLLPKISIDKNGEIKNFLLKSTFYLKEGFSPELLCILINNQYIESIKIETSVEQKIMMNISKHLIMSIQDFDIKLILDIIQLSNNDIKIYAEEFFYNKLPKDIKTKYNL